MNTTQIIETTETAWCVRFSSTSKFLAVSGLSIHLYIKDTQTNSYTLLKRIREHTKTVREVTFSPDERYLFSVSFDTQLIVFDLNNLEPICRITGPATELKSVSVTLLTQPAPKYLIATCSRDKTVWIYTFTGTDYELEEVIEEHKGDVKCVVWSTNVEEPVLVSCGYDNAIMLFRKNRLECTYLGTETIWSLDFLSAKVVACSHSGEVFLLDDRLCLLTALRVSDYPVYDVKVHGGRIYCGGAERTLYRLNEALEVERAYLFPEEINSIDAHDNTIVVALEDGRVVLFEEKDVV